MGQVVEDSITSQTSHTFFTTNHDDDGVSSLAKMVRQVARKVIGSELPKNDQERDRWREFGNVLIEELKQAGARAGSVSSAPAFFTAHLRRRFKTGQLLRSEAHEDTQVTKSQAVVPTKEQQLLKTIRELRMLHVGDPDYQEQDLLDDLKFRCDKASISWDENLARMLLSDTKR